MEIAKLRVNGNRCSIVYVRDVTRGLIGATIAIEYTDPVWDGLAKTVVFQTSSVTKDVVTNKSVVDVPHEVLENVDEVLSVGVYGTNSEDTVAIPTLWATVGVVKRSADPSGDESTAPTLPVWAQILEQLEELGDVDPDKIAEAVEQYISENPIEGESAYEIALKNGFEGSEQEWLASLEGEKGDPGEPGATGPAGQDGKDGFSPTVTVEDITGGHRITITDADGQKVFDVEDGESDPLPVASADTLGGVKVGNGLQMDGEVLGVVPEGEYELIETVETDVDTKIISRTHTPSGEKYCFRDVIVNIVYQSEHAREEWIRLKVWFDDNKTLNAFKDNSNGTLIGSQILRTNRYGNYTTIEISGITTNVGNIVPHNSLMKSNAFVLSSGNIYRIDIDRNDAFFIGDTLEIWGVRA